VTFEIDAPEQMDRKQAVLRDAGVTLPESIRACSLHIMATVGGSGLTPERLPYRIPAGAP